LLDRAGHRVPRRREGPAALTRQGGLEVIPTGLAQGSRTSGMTTLVIAEDSREPHEHIYTSDALEPGHGECVLPMQHALLPEEELISSRRPV